MKREGQTIKDERKSHGVEFIKGENPTPTDNDSAVREFDGLSFEFPGVRSVPPKSGIRSERGSTRRVGMAATIASQMKTRKRWRRSTSRVRAGFSGRCRLHRDLSCVMA